MARQGNGTYVLPAGNPVTPSTLIRSEWANTTLTDIANALTQSISKDGQTVASANLPMGGFKHTNVAAATANGEYAESKQVQNSDLLRLTTLGGSTGTAYLTTLPLNNQTWGDGVTFVFTPNVNNTGAATIVINAAAAVPLKDQTGLALPANALVAGTPYYIRKLGAAWFVFPLTTTGGAGNYVSKTGDTMTGTLTISNPIAASQLTLIPQGAFAAQVGIGVAPRNDGTNPYLLDCRSNNQPMVAVFNNSTTGASIKLTAASTAQTIDTHYVNVNGTTSSTPSLPLYFRMVNPAGVFFNAVTIDNLGSISANYKITARMYYASHFETTLAAGPVTLDMLQYQSWSLACGGNTQFTLTIFALGQMVRVFLRNVPNTTVTWTAGADTLLWPNSAGNLPPSSSVIGAGPVQCCLFTFFKFTNGYIIGQWAAY